MKIIKLLALILICGSALKGYSQLGIKGGVNLANEIKSFNGKDIAAGFSTDNLAGYQLGLVYQYIPRKTGFGFETGLLVSQKGYSYEDSTTTTGILKQGYKEINYLELPLNLRYRLALNFCGIFGFGGLYAGYALYGHNVVETDNITENIAFENTNQHIDYGYNLGAGIEFFRKIQFTLSWSQGIKNISKNNSPVLNNRVFSAGMTYIF